MVLRGIQDCPAYDPILIVSLPAPEDTHGQQEQQDCLHGQLGVAIHMMDILYPKRLQQSNQGHSSEMIRVRDDSSLTTGKLSISVAV